MKGEGEIDRDRERETERELISNRIKLLYASLLPQIILNAFLLCFSLSFNSLSLVITFSYFLFCHTCVPFSPTFHQHIT